MGIDFVTSLLPRAERAHRIWSGPLRGKLVVTSWRAYPRAILGLAERPLLRWMEANVRPGETWLDIGAHHGYTAVALSHLVGEAGRVFAFEAVPRTAGTLAATKVANGLQQLIVVPLALGNTPSIRRIETCPTASGMANYHARNNGLRESVFVVALDWIWTGLCHENERISGMKIDVQGWEIETIQGMLGLLKKYTPKMAVEVHEGVDRNVLLDLLTEAGYERTPMPVEAGTQQPGSMQLLDNRTYAFSPPGGAAGENTTRFAA
jgi:FkbM family methyltransferase